MGIVTWESARTVAKSLASRLQPKAVLVFGSVARENFGNDLDLLVVFEGNGKSADQLYREVTQALRKFSEELDIDYFVVEENRLRELWRGCSAFLRVILKEGRILYMKNAEKTWLKYAAEDLGMARSLFRDGYFRGVCYHGQQAFEKVLKALLIRQGGELEKTHRIRHLAVIGKRYGLQWNLQEDMIDFMDSIYRGRYPEEEGLLPGGEPAEEDARNLLAFVEDFFREHAPLQS